jgi:hypothetical protein
MKILLLYFFASIAQCTNSAIVKTDENEIKQIIIHFDSCASNIDFLNQRKVFYVNLVSEDNPGDHSVVISDVCFQNDKTTSSLYRFSLKNKIYILKVDSNFLIELNVKDSSFIKLNNPDGQGSDFYYSSTAIVDNAFMRSSSSQFVYIIHTDILKPDSKKVQYRLYHPLFTSPRKYWISNSNVITGIDYPEEYLLDSNGFPTTQYLLLLKNFQGNFEIN